MLSSDEKAFIRKGAKVILANLNKMRPDLTLSEKIETIIMGFFQANVLISEFNRNLTSEDEIEIIEFIRICLTD